MNNIQDFIHHPPKYILNLVLAKKNFYVTIKDGFITFKIFYLPSLKCQCGKPFCNHILYFLLFGLKLDPLVVKYINLVYDEFVDNMLVENLNNALYKSLIKKLEKDDCAICLQVLTEKKHRYDLFTCQKCNKMVHSKCMNVWRQQNSVCVFCRADL